MILVPVLFAACGRGAISRLEPGALDAAPAFVLDATPISDARPFDPDANGLGEPDAQAPDALPRGDAGRPRVDGGPRLDGGPRPDGGFDAGPRDAGASDAGFPECNVDEDCGSGRHCLPGSGRCVECFEEGQCSLRRVCDVSTYTCRFPCLNGNCGPGNVCDPSIDACVQCLVDSNCPPDRHCSAEKTCEECTIDSHCATVPGRSTCDFETRSCVGCTSNSACAAGEQCDLTLGVCVIPSQRGLCEPCTDDEECGGPNDLCVGLIDTTTMSFIDRGCGIDCSNLSCPSGYACVDVRNGTARQCRPAYAMRNPTCTAVRNLGASCPYSPNALDPGCGIANLQDARCVPTPSGGVCSVWCQSDADCPNGLQCSQPSSAGDPGVCF
ncbi:MAG: hypothetical protein HYV07_04195 [Deltaproteobacteria bacterium]|nr:hypothetical protein [Deltaproteobacteria bacterium]